MKKETNVKNLKDQDVKQIFNATKEPKVVYRAVRDCQYSDGQHVKQIFKAGEKLPSGWEPGHPGFERFLPENLVGKKDPVSIAAGIKHIQAVMEVKREAQRKVDANKIRIASRESNRERAKAKGK